MDDLLLQKCITFMDKKEALRQKHFFSNPDETATFAWFFKSTRYETIITMDLDRFSECVFDGAEAIAQVDGES